MLSLKEWKVVGKCDWTKGSKLDNVASPVHLDSCQSASCLEIGLLLSSGRGEAPLTRGSVNCIGGLGGQGPSASAGSAVPQLDVVSM